VMRITEAHDYDLTGELVDTPTESTARSGFFQIQPALISR
jgi:hypothetical protein